MLALFGEIRRRSRVVSMGSRTRKRRTHLLTELCGGTTPGALEISAFQDHFGYKPWRPVCGIEAVTVRALNGQQGALGGWRPRMPRGAATAHPVLLRTVADWNASFRSPARWQRWRCRLWCAFGSRRGWRKGRRPCGEDCRQDLKPMVDDLKKQSAAVWRPWPSMTARPHS